MGSNIQSILAFGFKGLIVEIECQLSNGLPSIVIVGLGNKAVDEAKERIRSAFSSSNIPLPRKRITINLAPADIPKESTSLDLAIAAAIITAGIKTKNPVTSNQAIIGEVGLNGAVRPVRGIIGKILAARKQGITKFYIPVDNLKQAALIHDVTLLPVKNVYDLYLDLTGEIILSVDDNVEPTDSIAPTQYEHALSDVAGQAQAKRALEIAAAGGHNILLSGPPGTGKSMIAKSLPSILPPLSQQEMLEITHLHSLADYTYERIVTARPFRSPHHSASHISIVGGGNNVLPGEITLSHRGVLFLDEMPEFGRQTIEALRQPLEDRMITVARAKQTIDYPADFILVATANPCPCGYYGTQKDCSCTPHQIHQYQRKLSGPIMDRIDIFVEVNLLDHTRLLTAKDQNEPDTAVCKRVLKARELQIERLGEATRLNASMSNKDIKKSALLEPASETLLNSAASSLELSGRSYMRLIKVARTIADLEQSKKILPQHISEALQYRSLRSPLP